MTRRRYAVGAMLVLGLVGGAAIAKTPPPAPAVAPPPPTEVSWKRDGKGRIEVVGSARGTRLEEATRTLQAVADRLDCLRTHTRHVKWTRLRWAEGRIQASAIADSAIYGNVALLAVRDLLPGRSTAGSGVQAIRTRGPSGAYRVKILVGNRRGAPPIRRAPPKAPSRGK